RRKKAMRSALHTLLFLVGLSVVTVVNRPAIADKLDAASIPTGAVYVCAAGSGKDRAITAIKLEEKVGAIGRRHPEMGPCQYARNACRRSGGRVYAADGSEITQADEAEYDKKGRRGGGGRGPRLRPRRKGKNPSRRSRIRQESEARARGAVIPQSP